jgi:hypothetical protein
MKRISIGHLVPVFGFLLALASAGCFGQTGSTDGTDESTLSSQSDNDPTSGDPQTGPSYKGKTAQALELKVHPTDDNGGPSPEPWEAQQGPSPEPWNGHAIIIATDPNPGTKP